MPKQCAICASSQRAIIDEALLSGQSIREVATRFRFGKNVVHRHRQQCISAAIRAADAEKKRESGNRLIEYAAAAQKVSLGVMVWAHKNGEGSLALQAAEQVRRNTETMAKLYGVGVGSRPTAVNLINVNISPETARRMATVFLQRHPELKEGADARPQ